MDKLVEIKKFRPLKPLLKDQQLKQRLRLLVCFGNNGSEVIFVTNDDQVYGFGNNRYGCLGLDTQIDIEVTKATNNKYLSNKMLANIYYGFGHCIGLTSNGRLYGWGNNEFGQLGIGSFEHTSRPQLIEEFVCKTVVAVSCGNSHTLALTTDGLVFAFGRNCYGQIGNSSQQHQSIPTRVFIKDKIISISSGKCHSLAVSHLGKAYVWGSNELGQLGHHSQDLRTQKKLFLSKRPLCMDDVINYKLIKGVCGPNHCLLLSADGYIFAFGQNDCGQIGNGCYATQFTAVRINNKIKFKDIFANYDNNISIAISSDDKYFIWGFGSTNDFKKKISHPCLLNESIQLYTVYDIYSKYTKISKTFETIVFNDLNVNNKKLAEEYVEMNETIDKIDKLSDCYYSLSSINSDIVETNTTSPKSSDLDYYDTNTTIQELMNTNVNQSSATSDAQSGDCQKSIQRCDSHLIFQKHLSEAFDNPDNSDLKIIVNSRPIYCHKTVLKIRNEKFWQKCETFLNNQNEIIVTSYSYKAFYAFIQFLYGISPQVNDENASDILRLVTIYKEQELKNLCSKHLENCIKLENVCFLYELAVNSGLPDLEERCRQFAANNWKNILRLDDFHKMQQILSKSLMKLVY
ncbi:RCC1 and BTB domain-containing protein 2-like [Oppia nitens]|uniref:RCC1 and BTB domain-containing protein 2-like n=1 Tax=Oppia nitens TaxID=1686743 RepID=UPI0023DC305F|nr:RCC1 and BTB domain-containing protein 2-like [Oppia nitens]